MSQIRKATINDLEHVVALVERYWALEGIPGFDAKALSALLGNVVNDRKLGCILIASSGAETIGYLIVVYVFSLEHLGLTAEIDELFVVKEFRSGGIGSALIKTAEQCAIHAGCTNLSLQISTGNTRAKEFYMRHGFRDRAGYRLLDKELKDYSPTENASHTSN